MGQFAGMTALVTGASNGIGAATAARLGAGGARVIAHYHRGAAEAEGVVEQIRARGGTAWSVQADLTTKAGTEALAERARPEAVDIVVNNAGSLIRRTGTLEMSGELWEQTLMLNLTSAVLLTQAVLPGMLERGRGYIVNVSSVAARTGGGVGAGAYAAAKAALAAWTKNLTKEFAERGIRANCVSPGTIDTNYHRRFSNEQMLKAVRAATPLGRLGTAEEVADVIVYLCTPGASFVQGQVIEVNGGFLMA